MRPYLLFTLLLALLSATTVGAQSGAPTPGPVYLVNLTQSSMQVDLNGGTVVTAPGLTALPTMQMSPVRLGTRSSAETPSAGQLATGSNILTLNVSGAVYVATLKLGFIGPTSSPSGIAATCVIYLTFFSVPAQATVTCRLGNGGETTITSAPLVPRS